MKGGKGCWARRTPLERVLICVTAVTVLVAVVLIFLVAYKQAYVRARFCNTTICLGAASQIADYVDPDINPCEDFYNYACGNFLKTARGDETLALSEQLQIQAKRELLHGYAEPIGDGDHKMVKTAKALFKACMNESQIESDNLRSMKEAVRILGGWPVVEGKNWNEKNFDWLRVSYKLRKLGFHYSVFMEMVTEPDPENASKYIFKVVMPDMWDYNTHNFDKVEIMTETAKIFGVRNESRAVEEMTQAHAFLVQLQMEIHNHFTNAKPDRYTLHAYQKECPSINWVQFVSEIAGSKVNVSRNDSVIFPSPNTLKSWLSLIERTPKRIQANYMIWKVIEMAFPYLPEIIRNLDPRPKGRQTRQEFCLQELQELFNPSPIDVICDRKYLPSENKKKVEELLLNIKGEFIESLGNLKWLSLEDRKELERTAMGIVMVLGQPGNYFEDDILDELDVETIDRDQTFLNMFAQANRNRLTKRYGFIKKSPQENVYEKWYYRNSGTLPVYGEEDNIIYIPAINTQGLLYHEDRPNYLNYGGLGTKVGQLIGGIIMRYLTPYSSRNAKVSFLTEELQEKIKCFQTELGKFELTSNNFEFGVVVQQSIGEQLAYKAYRKWVKHNGTEEQELIGDDHSQNQLFWISSAATLCQPLNNFGSMQKIFQDETIFSVMVSGSVRNSPQFSDDFQCKLGSYMNPSTRCELP